MNPKKPQHEPASFVRMFDSAGLYAGEYPTRKEAIRDALGTRFAEGFTLVKYARVPWRDLVVVPKVKR